MSLFSSPPPELFAATAAGAATAAAAVAEIDPADHPPLRGRGLRWVLLGTPDPPAALWAGAASKG